MAYQPYIKYRDLEDYLNKRGYTEISERLGALSDASTKNALSQLEAQRNSYISDAAENARQAYINYVRAKNALPQQLEYSGYNGGAADTLKASLENEYQNAHAKILEDRYNALRKLDEQKATLKYDASLKKAEELYKIYLSAASDYGSLLDSEEERAFKDYLNEKENENKLMQMQKDYEYDQQLLKEQNDFKASQNELERQNKLIGYAVRLGDYSTLKKAGLNVSSSQSSGGNSTKNNSYSDSLNFALTAAKYGDYSYLKALGINVDLDSASGTASNGSSGTASSTNLSKELSLAEKLASYGNYELLSQLTGISVNELKKQREPKQETIDNNDFTPAVPIVDGFKEAIVLFMKGDTDDKVLKVISKAYPNYTFEQVFALWRNTAYEKFGFIPAAHYNGPEKYEMESGGSESFIDKLVKVKNQMTDAINGLV